jgi:hypothetical protein
MKKVSRDIFDFQLHDGAGLDNDERRPWPVSLTAASFHHAQLFRLAVATGTQDSLIMKSVCFLTDDGAYGQKLAEHVGGVGMIEKSLWSIDGNLYLF